MQNRYWYAIQKKSDDPWDYGSYNYRKAKAMLREQGFGMIAVIHKDANYCEGIIKYDDIMEDKK